jgi:hypothetical protein
MQNILVDIKNTTTFATASKNKVIGRLAQLV